MDKVYHIYDENMVLRAEVKVNGISVIDLVQDIARGIPNAKLCLVTPNGMIRLAVPSIAIDSTPLSLL